MRAPRLRVEQRGKLFEHDLADASPPLRLRVEHRGSSARGGEELEHVDIVLLLVEEHEERPRRPGVRPVRQVDNIVASTRTIRLRGLEPGSFLRLEDDANLLRPNTAGMTLQIRLRAGEPRALRPGHAVCAVVREIVWSGEHLRAQRATDEAGAREGERRPHRSPWAAFDPGTRWQKSHSLGTVGAESSTNDA